MTNEKKFEEIKSIRISIKNTFKNITEKHTEIKEQYKKYIDNNKKSELLDSFYFQIKLMNYEYETTEKTYNLIDNRMYCDYYKLFIIVYNFFKSEFKSEKSEMIIKNAKYPVYKDLDQFKQYDFDTVNDIHQDIIRLIEYVFKIIQNNKEDIKIHQIKVNNGLNIDNYIFDLEYKNNVITNHISLYQKFLNSYHKYHISFLTNFYNKLNLMYDQLENDVNFTQPIKEKKHNMICKMCIICCNKEAEYCNMCNNNDDDDYDRFSVLRESMNDAPNTRKENKSNVIPENVIPKNVMPENVIHEEPLLEESLSEEPVIVENPLTEEPVIVESPIIEEPLIKEPIVEITVIENPIIEKANVENTVIENPIIEEENIEKTVIESSLIEEPIVENPLTEEPIVENPIIEESVIEEPIVENTIIKSPVIEEPIVESHVIEESVIEEPVIEEPIVENTIIKSPVIEEPIVESNVIESPIIEEPIVENTIIETPVIEEPIVENTIVESPVIEEPIVESPVIEEPIIENPVIESPVIEESVIIDSSVIEEIIITQTQVVEEFIQQETIIYEPNIVESQVTKEIGIAECPAIPENEITIDASPTQLFTIYETNNDDKLLNKIENDITIDNATNTTSIENKLNQSPPFFLDLNLNLQNELSHPNQKRKKNKKNKK